MLGRVLAGPDQLDLTADLPGIARTGDYAPSCWTSLRVSYDGDHKSWYVQSYFHAFLLPGHTAEQGRALWDERPRTFRAITTRPGQLLMPMELCVTYLVNDNVMLKAHDTALKGGAVVTARSPALHAAGSAPGRVDVSIPPHMGVAATGGWVGGGDGGRVPSVQNSRGDILQENATFKENFLTTFFNSKHFQKEVTEIGGKIRIWR